jgi:hypothetical protein
VATIFLISADYKSNSLPDLLLSHTTAALTAQHHGHTAKLHENISLSSKNHFYIMADVDMTDAPVPAPKVAKASKSEGADKKPRFEVKKASGSTPL